MPLRNVRADFPAINQSSRMYLDSAATAQKPAAVIAALSDWYSKDYAPVHRGIYRSAEIATQRYEDARTTVARFIGAERPDEIVFTRNSTSGINIAARSWAAQWLRPGDELVLNHLEHHANILPWERLAHELGLTIRWIPLLPDTYGFDLSQIETWITSKTALVALAPASHIVGTPTTEDLQKIILRARAVGAKIFLDAAQLVPHARIDVQKLDCDALVFSGHKLYGPTGIGVLYLRKQEHSSVVPYELGGGMVDEVTNCFTGHRWRQMPWILEAGTPDAAGAIGLAAAIEYLMQFDFTAVMQYESGLIQQFVSGLRALPDYRIVGTPSSHLTTFFSTKYHAHDIAAYLNRDEICVRAGSHCAQGAHALFKRLDSVRLSVGLYTTEAEIAAVLSSLAKIPASSNFSAIAS